MKSLLVHFVNSRDLRDASAASLRKPLLIGRSTLRPYKFEIAARGV
jgi:hypothetical protein